MTQYEKVALSFQCLFVLLASANLFIAILNLIANTKTAQHAKEIKNIKNKRVNLL